MESLAPSGSSATTRRSSPDFQPGVPRILLVEDAEELVAIWRALFRTTAWDTRFATTAKMALTIVADGFLPDILVSD